MASEFQLIRELIARLGDPSSRVLVPSGDDAAVVRCEGVAVTSIDSYVDGVHFRLENTSMHDLGRKCAAGALSDLAAMGCAAGELYVALGLPPESKNEQIAALVDGIQALAAEVDAAVCGGDIVSSKELFVTITATGHAGSVDDLVLRSDARPGDLLGVTGSLGGAAAGLLLLDQEAHVAGTAQRDELIARYLHPTPLISTGRALAKAGVSAMIDVSDGVASDARRLSEASSVGVTVNLTELPIQAGVAEAAESAGQDPAAFAASGGEDYELLIACSPEKAEAAGAAALATSAKMTWIGSVEPGSEVRLLDADGVPRELRGWDHLERSRENRDRR